MAPKMKLPSKGGKGSKTPTPKRKVVPECKLNRNFDERLETFAEKKMWPERGIDLESLRDTPVPTTVNDMGWGGLAATPPHYSESLVKEFYAGMNPGEYMRGGPILVRGVPVYLNAPDINIYFGTTLLEIEGLRERMVEGITTNPLYVKNLVEFANTMTITPMTVWMAKRFPLRQSNLKIEQAFWHIFLNSSLRPVSHRSTVPFEVARILHSIIERQPIDVGIIVKMEIQRIGRNESETDILPFPCLITEACKLAGVDISGDILKPPMSDMDLTTWRRLMIKRGEIPTGGKRRRVRSSEAGTSVREEFERVIPEEDDDDEEEEIPICDDHGQPLGLRILDGVQRIRKTQTGDFDILHADKLDIEERQKALEDRQLKLESLIQDLSETVITGFTDLRHDLRLTPYVRRPKKPTTVIPPTPTAPSGHSTEEPDFVFQTAQSAVEEAAQLEEAMARSLTDQGPRYVGGPPIDEAAAQRRWREEQSRRAALAREQRRKDPKGKGRVEQDEEEDSD
jgi:hypothetical protein